MDRVYLYALSERSYGVLREYHKLTITLKIPYIIYFKSGVTSPTLSGRGVGRLRQQPPVLPR